MKISPHFEDYELLSPKLLEAIHDKDTDPKFFIREDALDFLEDLRIYFGTPVSVNHKGMNKRGICTTEENLKEGRTITSQHNFCAFDISLYKENIDLVYSWIKKNALSYNIGGIGRYDTFIHVDFRNNDKISEWDGRS